MNKIKKELFETFEDLKDVAINGETFKARGKMVFLTEDNKELEEAVEEKGLMPYLVVGDIAEDEPKPTKGVKNANRGKNK